MDKIKAGYLEGFVSIFVNTVLFVLKLWAGIVSGSIALMADAWHTLSDSVSSLIVVAAAGLSDKKPDAKHPYGHGRWEQIAALFIAFLLAFIAFGFLKDSVILFISKEKTEFGIVAIIVISISVVTKEALAQFAFYIFRKSGNLAVKADAWHHRTDSLSSVLVLAGILFAGRFWWLDSVLGVIISLMLFYATYKIAREAISKLLGEKMSIEKIDNIKAAIKNVHHTDLHAHHFHIHNYTTHNELTFHIYLDSDMSIEGGHHIATEAERIILDKFGIIATIHVEPRE